MEQQGNQWFYVESSTNISKWFSRIIVEISSTHETIGCFVNLQINNTFILHTHTYICMVNINIENITFILLNEKGKCFCIFINCQRNKQSPHNLHARLPASWNKAFSNCWSDYQSKYLTTCSFCSACLKLKSFSGLTSSLILPTYMYWSQINHFQI